MRTLREKLYMYLGQYAFFARVFGILLRTPRPALHWYLILLLGVVIVLVNVIFAWLAFVGIDVDVYGAEFAVEATTIQRAELQSVLELYETKSATFEALKQQPPIVVDPGR